MCISITFYKKRTIVKHSNNRIVKNFFCAQVEGEGGDKYIRSKCIIGNYERNMTNFVKITQLQSIEKCIYNTDLVWRRLEVNAGRSLRGNLNFFAFSKASELCLQYYISLCRCYISWPDDSPTDNSPKIVPQRLG